MTKTLIRKILKWTVLTAVGLLLFTCYKMPQPTANDSDEYVYAFLLVRIYAFCAISILFCFIIANFPTKIMNWWTKLPD
jgi:hypothetical protein